MNKGRFHDKTCALNVRWEMKGRVDSHRRATAPPTGREGTITVAAKTDSSTTIMAENDSIDCVTEHERILQEIESTDTACVGPTLR